MILPENRYRFLRIMLQAIKKPRTFSGGASVQMMRSSSYARTSPEARQGFAVFPVRLVLMVMARAYAGDFDWRQRVSR
jgi:hypothetical protein